MHKCRTIVQRMMDQNIVVFRAYRWLLANDLYHIKIYEMFMRKPT